MRLRDLLPNLPHEGPPVPRFLFPKEEGGQDTGERERSSRIIAGETSAHLRPSSHNELVTKQETIAYQNRELAKVLLVLEGHLNQGCKIAGKPCDCCVKHPLELEKLIEEVLTMTSAPVYQDTLQFAHEVEQKTSVPAVKSGKYAAQYPVLAQHARDLRKRIMVLDGGSPGRLTKGQIREALARVSVARVSE